VIGNHLGVQELPKDCHIPVDVSPIVYSRAKENTPPKIKSEYLFQNIFFDFIIINKIKQL